MPEPHPSTVQLPLCCPHAAEKRDKNIKNNITKKLLCPYAAELGSNTRPLDPAKDKAAKKKKTKKLKLACFS